MRKREIKARNRRRTSTTSWPRTQSRRTTSNRTCITSSTIASTSKGRFTHLYNAYAFNGRKGPILSRVKELMQERRAQRENNGEAFRRAIRHLESMVL
jgi:hypothetical protein